MKPCQPQFLPSRTDYKLIPMLRMTRIPATRLSLRATKSCTVRGSLEDEDQFLVLSETLSKDSRNTNARTNRCVELGKDGEVCMDEDVDLSKDGSVDTSAGRNGSEKSLFIMF